MTRLKKVYVRKVFRFESMHAGLLLIILIALSTSGLCQKTNRFAFPEEALLLSHYIQQASVSGNEKKAGQYLADVCLQKGLYVEELSCEKGYNFAASIYPLSSNKPNIVLLNHIDVVPAEIYTGWAFPPFSGAMHNGRVWGRGAIDMKGVAIMQLMAIYNIKNSLTEELPYNITLLSVSGEETDNVGIQTVVDNYFGILNPVVAFGEGGSGIEEISSAYPNQPFYFISVAEKKSLWLKLNLRINTSGHGSVPPLTYATQEMSTAIHHLLSKKQKIHLDPTTLSFFKTLSKHEKGFKKFILKYPRLNKGLIKPGLRKDPMLMANVTNTITVTQIQSPSLSPNQIAQEIEVVLDCRLLPNTDQDEFIATVKNALRNDDINISVIKGAYKSTSSEKGTFFHSLKKAVKTVYPNSEVVPILSPVHTDNNFVREKGIPVYGLTPVLLSNEQLLSIHNLNENIRFDQLISGVKVYQELLSNIISEK